MTLRIFNFFLLSMSLHSSGNTAIIYDTDIYLSRISKLGTHIKISSYLTSRAMKLRGGSDVSRMQFVESKKSNQMNDKDQSKRNHGKQTSFTLAGMDISDDEEKEIQPMSRQQSKEEDQEEISRRALETWSEASVREEKGEIMEDDPPQHIWLLGGRRDEV